MASNQRKASIQPRPTKASLLRLQKQQASGLVTHEKPVESPRSPPVETATTPKRASNNTASATEGVKAFMAQQRARLVKKPGEKKEEEAPVKRNFMTGAQRYGGGSTHDAPVITQTKGINSVVKQAKAQGKLNISSRGLIEIPKEVLNMYHVDPNSIVVDFTSDSAGWYEAVELTKFVAGDNALTKIDDRVGEEFGALTHVDFRSNKLTSIPDTFKLLRNLTSILMPYNSFEELPQVICQLQQLKQLDLSHNKIKTVALSDNTIEQLDLSYNEISSFSVDQTVAHLRKLNLAHNRITELPSALPTWTKLQELQVNQNKLQYLFSTDEEVTLSALVRLDAGNNMLTVINKKDNVIVSMPNLVELSLADNRFVEDGLIGLHGTPLIKTLNIASNKLQYVPASVTSLNSLERLDIRGNQLHALPYELGKLTELKAIQCEGNPMRSFASMSQIQLIESLRNNYNLEQGEKEESVESGLVEDEDVAADNFTQKVNLTQRLDLSKQQLTELSSESMKFTEDIPGVILLHHNLFTEFPSSLSIISTFIVHLDLEHNKLTSFNFSIENVAFSSLKTLKLSNNRINTLTTGDTTSFPKVEELRLSHNALTELPENLPQTLPSLKILSLNSNKLDVITEKSFGQGLETLDLSNNDIGFLPPGLSSIEPLKELFVYGNRFRVPRPAIVDQGTRAILEFLKRRNTTTANN